ncbi:chemotaxis protein CheD [Natronorubrum sp. JWXQ-INN-674]|uniref:Probable chemoreceptor glutamine deamidase CheD n=1 Tax=Natronorubrum halalkaliphilum TaxID=2691917 RepID=A0A6B0VLY6_9EURY|nr:chemotaxis protein CheD [Natronorubrum halalkaliphilum]MXV61782.1 chemotaxis protein CheD [Natronorubrum halalkaliphilum]
MLPTDDDGGRSTDDDADPTGSIPIGIAEYAVTGDDVPLKTSGLGSCIGVAVHDEFAGVSGLLHFMLPVAAETTSQQHPAAKFADTGIESMLAEFTDRGGDPARSWAKLAGGATMVEFHQTGPPIGERNATAVRRELEAANVSILESDFGGYHGRSIEFDPATGILTVTSADGTVRRL